MPGLLCVVCNHGGGIVMEQMIEPLCFALLKTGSAVIGTLSLGLPLPLLLPSFFPSFHYALFGYFADTYSFEWCPTLELILTNSYNVYVHLQFEIKCYEKEKGRKKMNVH